MKSHFLNGFCNKGWYLWEKNFALSLLADSGQTAFVSWAQFFRTTPITMIMVHPKWYAKRHLHSTSWATLFVLMRLTSIDNISGHFKTTVEAGQRMTIVVVLWKTCSLIIYLYNNNWWHSELGRNEQHPNCEG